MGESKFEDLKPNSLFAFRRDIERVAESGEVVLSLYRKLVYSEGKIICLNASTNVSVVFDSKDEVVECFVSF